MGSVREFLHKKIVEELLLFFSTAFSDCQEEWWRDLGGWCWLNEDLLLLLMFYQLPL